MLSPGQWHKQVPKDRTKNLIFRQRVLRLCRQHAWARKAAVEACKQDILLFISVFGFQYNPKHVGSEVGPFITWDFQEKAVLETLEQMFGGHVNPDVLWEKSREVGATWLALFLDSWLCLFHGWKKLFVISHSEDAVDRPGDPDCLFWKVQHILGHLPSWMAKGVTKRKLAFQFPNNSNLNGAATTVRSGVGGRATKLTLEEFSKQGNDREILGHTADIGPRLIIGTHYEMEKQFYQLTQRADLKKIVMHWSMHPEKARGLYASSDDHTEVLDTTYRYPPDFKFVLGGNESGGGPFPTLRSPWYDGEVTRRASKRDVAMHLDINPSGSQSQFFEPSVVRVLIAQFCKRPVWEGNLLHDDQGYPTGLVKQKGGPLQFWIHPRPDDTMPAGVFVIGGDIAQGTGASPSCATVANAMTGEKVAAYVNPHVSIQDYAPLFAALGRLFSDGQRLPAYAVWEASGGVGEEFSKWFFKTGYRHVWYRETPQSYAGMRKHSDKPGWMNTPQSMMALMVAYRSSLAQRKFINRCEVALGGTLNYRYVGNTVEHPSMNATDDPSGARVNHGDRSMADALADMLREELSQGVREPEPERDPIPYGSLAYRQQMHRERELEEEYA